MKPGCAGYTIAQRFSAHRGAGAARLNTALADVRTFILNEPEHRPAAKRVAACDRGEAMLTFGAKVEARADYSSGSLTTGGLEVIVWFGVAFFVLGIIIVVVGVSWRRFPPSSSSWSRTTAARRAARNSSMV
jgi:hypothetical protein